MNVRKFSAAKPYPPSSRKMRIISRRMDMGKPLRSERDEAYAMVWNAVRGGIRDFRAAHPDEILPSGNREASLIKRIVGQVESLANRLSVEQPADKGE